METGPRLKVSSGRLVKPEIEPATPGLQGKQIIHYTTVAPSVSLSPGTKIIKSFMLNSTEHKIPTAHKTKLPKNKDFSCFQSLRCAIYLSC